MIWSEFEKLLSSEQWTAVSALATAAQAGAAFFGLWFIGRQIKQANKSSDLQSLQTFLQTVRDHERALIDAKDENKRDEAFLEFVNFLELQAAALHGRLFPKITKKIVIEKIRDSIALIEAEPSWLSKLLIAQSSDTTFEHLQRFSKKQRRQIDKVKQARLNLQAADN